MQVEISVDRKYSIMSIISPESGRCQSIALWGIEGVSWNGEQTIISTSAAEYLINGNCHNQIVSAWKGYLRHGGDELEDDAVQPDEPLWSFHLDGMEYGLKQVSQLRNGLIQHRDAALKARDFGTSILLSHVIATIYNMAERVWGDAWVEFQNK